MAPLGRPLQLFHPHPVHGSPPLWCGYGQKILPCIRLLCSKSLIITVMRVINVTSSKPAPLDRAWIVTTLGLQGCTLLSGVGWTRRTTTRLR